MVLFFSWRCCTRAIVTDGREQGFTWQEPRPWTCCWRHNITGKPCVWRPWVFHGSHSGFTFSLRLIQFDARFQLMRKTRYPHWGYVPGPWIREIPDARMRGWVLLPDLKQLDFTLCAMPLHHPAPLGSYKKCDIHFLSHKLLSLSSFTAVFNTFILILPIRYLGSRDGGEREERWGTCCD